MKVEQIILVDPSDQQIGEIEKHLCHQFGMLHRAFSVFIFREKEGQLQTLLQQRSDNKYHGRNLWTNACCSHPHTGEDITQSAQTRLKKEMGIDISLKEVGKFHYIAVLDHGMTENEIDHVFIGIYDRDNISFDASEVKNFQWVSTEQLKVDLKNDPKKYTPWLKQAFEIALAHYSDAPERKYAD